MRKQIMSTLLAAAATTGLGGCHSVATPLKHANLLNADQISSDQRLITTDWHGVISAVPDNAPIYDKPSLDLNNEAQHTGNLIIFMDEAFKPTVIQAVQARGDTLIYDYKKLGGIAIKPRLDLSLADTKVYYSKLEGVYTVNEDYLNQQDEYR